MGSAAVGPLNTWRPALFRCRARCSPNDRGAARPCCTADSRSTPISDNECLPQAISTSRRSEPCATAWGLAADSPHGHPCFMDGGPLDFGVNAPDLSVPPTRELYDGPRSGAIYRVVRAPINVPQDRPRAAAASRQVRSMRAPALGGRGPHRSTNDTKQAGTQKKSHPRVAFLSGRAPATLRKAGSDRVLRRRMCELLVDPCQQGGFTLRGQHACPEANDRPALRISGDLNVRRRRRPASRLC